MRLGPGLGLTIVCLLLGGTALAEWHTGAHAAAPVAWYVNNVTGNDANGCRTGSAPCRTIGGAMSKARPGDVISISGNTYPGGISVAKSLTVRGAGPGKTVLKGGAPVVRVNGGITVSFSGLSITGGKGSNGEGLANYGTLIVSNVVVSNNIGQHGGVANYASLTAINSVIRGNTARFQPPALAAGGGIFNRGKLTLLGSSVSINSSPFDGGGIENQGILDATNAIISKNSSADAGGGIDNSGKVTLAKSTVSGNAARLLPLAYSNSRGGGIMNHGTLSVTSSAISGNTSDFEGGGIASDGTVTISRSTISGNTTGLSVHNHAVGGGGISNRGTLTVDTSIFTNNAAENGGGLFNAMSPFFTGGTAQVTNSTFIGNSARPSGGSVGGGIANQYQLTVSGSVFRDNTSDYGGGIGNQAALSVTNSTVDRNTSAYGGGGLFNDGDATATASTFKHNITSTGNGGGLFNSRDRNLTVLSSTINDNAARYPGAMAAEGGGIFNWGTLTMANGTVTGNSADGTAGSLGGGIGNFGSASLSNSTISGNSVPVPPAYYRTTAGGGIANATLTDTGWAQTGKMTVDNVLIAANTAPFYPDSIGPLTDGSRGHNLLATDDGSSGLLDGRLGDQVGSLTSPIRPLLGPLQNNGGPTLTMALLTGSPAINRGDNTTCTAAGPAGVNNRDQRGYLRITSADPTCDIGAYEYGAH